MPTPQVITEAEDMQNKVETLNGYLQAITEGKHFSPGFIFDIVSAADEWLATKPFASALAAREAAVWEAVLGAVPEKSMECSQDNKAGMHYECYCGEKEAHNAARSALVQLRNSRGFKIEV